MTPEALMPHELSREEKVADILLRPDIQAVRFSIDPPFRWASGTYHPVYTDNRILDSFPDARKKIHQFFMEEIRKRSLAINGVVAVISGGISFGTRITDELNLPLIKVRADIKDHGLQSPIQGKIEKGQRFLFIEDLFSTGSSVCACIQAVQEAGGKAVLALSIMTYEWEEASRNFQRLEIETDSLTNVTTLLRRAISLNYFPKDQEEIILDWKNDPRNWGRRIGFDK